MYSRYFQPSKGNKAIIKKLTREYHELNYETDRTGGKECMEKVRKDVRPALNAAK